MEGRCRGRDTQGGKVGVNRAGMPVYDKSDIMHSLSNESSMGLFTPEGLRRAEESGELDVDANILNLRPDPTHFVNFLKSVDRPEIASSLFTRLLEAYRESKTSSDSDPLRYVFSCVHGTCIAKYFWCR